MEGGKLDKWYNLINSDGKSGEIHLIIQVAVPLLMPKFASTSNSNLMLPLPSDPSNSPRRNTDVGAYPTTPRRPSWDSASSLTRELSKVLI